MKFENFFSEVQLFSDYSYVVSGYLDKDIAKEMFEKETGEDIESHEIRVDYVRFGFPPENIEGCEDFENDSIWYTGATGRGSKPVWIYKEGE